MLHTTGSLVVLANGVMDVISHSNVSLAPLPETLSLSTLQVLRCVRLHLSPQPSPTPPPLQRSFIAVDQLLAENHLSRFLDIVPKGLAGYLQKGFFDLRSCIQVHARVAACVDGCGESLVNSMISC